MRRNHLLLILISLCAVSGCSNMEPWVKPFERQNLADPLMNPDRDPISAGYRHHVFETRQASRGAGSVSGGGCGCN